MHILVGCGKKIISDAVKGYHERKESFKLQNPQIWTISPRKFADLIQYILC